MYILLVTVALCFLGGFQPAVATSNLRVRDLQAAGLRDAAFRNSARRENFGNNIQRLDSRQIAPLPIAPAAQCDEYDGYFYVSSSNYTWQLQCTTNYIGSVISTENADSLAACIENCAAFNAANEPGSCLGINFNAANNAAVGQCTQYSDVQDLLLASEEGNVQDSALLILGPDGHIYATPQPAPTFSGAPSQPPTADPVPTSTTSGPDASSSSSTTLSTTASTTSPGVVLGTTTITTTITSTNFVTSCPLGSTACLSTSSTWVSTSSGSAGSSAKSSYTSMSMTIGLSSTPPAQVTTTGSSTSTTFTTTPGGVVVAAITTFTMVVPVTVYTVQPIVNCTGVTPSCSLTTVTSTSVGYRTELSCTPSACAGITAGAVADAAFVGTCLLS